MRLAALFLILVPICLFDYARCRIPNPLLFAVFIAGLADGYFAGGTFQSIHYIIKAISVTAAFFPFFKIGMIGAGDVKLLGLCAGFFSGVNILYFLFFSMLIAAIFSIVKMLKEQNFRERFVYFGEYVCDILQSGKWKLYMEDLKSKKSAGLCLSGPVFISVIMYMGGLY